MNYQMIATPIVGAIIGYTTNWVAIKMLFRPYTEKRLFGMKIPFTPGLIPKERLRISGAIGEVVEQYLLTDEVIVSELTSDTICQAIGLMLEEELGFNEGTLDISRILKDQVEKENRIQDLSKIIGMKLMEWFLEEETKAIFLPKIKAVIKQYLNQQDIKSLFQNNEALVHSLSTSLFSNENVVKLSAILEGYMHQDQTLFELIGPEIKGQIQGILVFNEPKIKQTLKDLFQKETIASSAKEMISSVIANKFGALGAMFANPESIYESMVVALNEKVDSTQISSVLFSFLEENMQTQLFDWVPEYTRKVLSGQISEKMLNEVTKKWLLSYLNQSDKTPYQWLVQITNSKIDVLLEQWIEGLYADFSQNQLQVQNVLESNLNLMINKMVNQPIIVSPQTRASVMEKVMKGYKFFVKKYVVKMIQTSKLSTIVEKQINTFEIPMLEDLILAIAKKELSAITWLGALLGFIMSIIILFFK